MTRAAIAVLALALLACSPTEPEPVCTFVIDAATDPVVFVRDSTEWWLCPDGVDIKRR